jgi:hypothetical protein
MRARALDAHHHAIDHRDDDAHHDERQHALGEDSIPVEGAPVDRVIGERQQGDQAEEEIAHSGCQAQQLAHLPDGGL